MKVKFNCYVVLFLPFLFFLFGCQKKQNLQQIEGSYRITDISKYKFFVSHDAGGKIKLNDILDIKIADNEYYFYINGEKINNKKIQYIKSKYKLECFVIGLDTFGPHSQKVYDEIYKINEKKYVIKSKKAYFGFKLWFLPYYKLKKSKILMQKISPVPRTPQK